MVGASVCAGLGAMVLLEEACHRRQSSGFQGLSVQVGSVTPSCSSGCESSAAAAAAASSGQKKVIRNTFCS